VAFQCWGPVWVVHTRKNLVNNDLHCDSHVTPLTRMLPISREAVKKIIAIALISSIIDLI